ncbi:hypothetical protein P7K49_005852 [Saguinus oedipus]|uniref:Uncharacterized protein n=1 Tax=Saguinus oedipus TaxID=9490 RepID=A0ABQ9W0S1_SAGOE|nr:hypothetical protein P7K49_005852 [Saguinus oedipus]
MPPALTEALLPLQLSRGHGGGESAEATGLPIVQLGNRSTVLQSAPQSTAEGLSTVSPVLPLSRERPRVPQCPQCFPSAGRGQQGWDASALDASSLHSPQPSSNPPWPPLASPALWVPPPMGLPFQGSSPKTVGALMDSLPLSAPSQGHLRLQLLEATGLAGTVEARSAALIKTSPPPEASSPATPACLPGSGLLTASLSTDLGREGLRAWGADRCQAEVGTREKVPGQGTPTPNITGAHTYASPVPTPGPH